MDRQVETIHEIDMRALTDRVLQFMTGTAAIENDHCTKCGVTVEKFLQHDYDGVEVTSQHLHIAWHLANVKAYAKLRK